MTYKTKIGFTSGVVFGKLLESPVGKTKMVWSLSEQFLDVDFKTYGKDINLEKSIVDLASKKCIRFKPFIVSTKNKVDVHGTCFTVITPKQAIDMYDHENFLK